MMEGDTVTDNRTGMLLDPEVDSTYWKEKVLVDFIVFIGHQIACRRVEEIHILNDIYTLGT